MLRLMLVMLTIMCCVLLVRRFSHCRCLHSGSSVRRQLEDGFLAIRDEYMALPLRMISKRHRKPSEWGQNIHEWIEVHKRGIGWVYAWKNETEANTQWLNFGLVFGGRPIGQNCSLCP